MRVSVCITTFNESEAKVKKLLNALHKQTFKPDEIILIDAKDYDNCSRSKGRNIAIKKAKNKIIAITDIGCIPHINWLEEIVNPFDTASPNIKNLIVVAGNYEMVSKNNFQKACSVFLGVDQRKINDNFMPSARSMALTKSVWKKVGGFPEEMNDTAEDTLFNLNLIDSGAKFTVATDAIVDWEMPNTLQEFIQKIYRYAKGDAKSGIWWHPIKKLETHNIKIVGIILRYVFGLLLLFSGYYNYFIFYLVLYLAFAFWKARLWGVLLQFVSDFACIIGFSHGILQTSIKRH